MGRIVINIKGRAFPWGGGRGMSKAMEVRMEYSWSRDLEGGMEEGREKGREGRGSRQPASQSLNLPLPEDFPFPWL